MMRSEVCYPMDHISLRTCLVSHIIPRIILPHELYCFVLPVVLWIIIRSEPNHPMDYMVPWTTLLHESYYPINYIAPCYLSPNEPWYAVGHIVPWNIYYSMNHILRNGQYKPMNHVPSWIILLHISCYPMNHIALKTELNHESIPPHE